MDGVEYQHGYVGFVEYMCSICECNDKSMNCVKKPCEEVNCPSGKLIKATAKCCPVCEGEDSEVAPLDASPVDEQENIIKHKKHKHPHDFSLRK